MTAGGNGGNGAVAEAAATSWSLKVGRRSNWLHLDPEVTMRKVLDVPDRKVARGWMNETNLGFGLEQEASLNFQPSGQPPAGRGGPDVSGSASLMPERAFGEGPPWRPVRDTSRVPWRCICYLSITYDSGRSFVGTGWLSSPDTVITAAHNIFSHEGDGEAMQVKVAPGRNGSTFPAPVTWARSAKILPSWRKKGTPRFDLGALKMEQPVGQTAGYFGYMVLDDSELDVGPIVHTAGYPTVGGAGVMWYDHGRLFSHTPDFLHYRTDTEAGQSGGPVFAKLDGQRYVIGVHGYGGHHSNFAVRITNELFDVIADWSW